MTKKKTHLQRAVRPRPNSTAITVDKETTWYYESRRHIEIIHWCKGADGTTVHASNIKIPWKLLIESARRCRPEAVKTKAV